MTDEDTNDCSTALLNESTKGAPRFWPAGVELVARSLREGHLVSDALFDRFLPDALRRRSAIFWTPVGIAMQVAAWLEREGVKSVVDLGSGCGKLCVVAALATKTTTFVGVEQRRHLIDAAESLAGSFELSHRVRFVHRCLESGAIPKADAYYLFNPFEENLFQPGEPTLDSSVELSQRRYREDVRLMVQFFEQAPLGTYVIKYFGFGGRMPKTYEPLEIYRDPPGALRLWRKTRI